MRLHIEASTEVADPSSIDESYLKRYYGWHATLRFNIICSTLSKCELRYFLTEE